MKPTRKSILSLTPAELQAAINDPAVVWIGPNITLRRDDFCLHRHPRLSYPFYRYDSRPMAIQLEEAREGYEELARRSPSFRRLLQSLAGKTLLCTCGEDGPCHGDILTDLCRELNAQKAA